MSAEQIDAEKLEEAIKIVDEYLRGWGPSDLRAAGGLLVAAARAHLATLPRVKEVEVWHVEYAQNGPCIALYETEPSAHGYARMLSGISNVSNIRVTGPHKQKVPA